MADAVKTNLTAADRDRLDLSVLESLSTRGQEPTYVIRNVLDWPGKPWHRKGLMTSAVLRSCRRLERRGHVIEARTSYAVMKAWEITPLGRSALSEHRQ